MNFSDGDVVQVVGTSARKSISRRVARSTSNGSADNSVVDRLVEEDENDENDMEEKDNMMDDDEELHDAAAAFERRHCALAFQTPPWLQRS